jgi:membrane-bound serine protease (ClpP class)
MSTIIGFIAAALVLVFFEVILPGGILGILAALCVLVASWLGYAEYGVVGGAGVFLGSICAIALLVYLEFKVIARTKLGSGFFLKTSVTGHSNVSKAEETIIGKEGTALTRLNPSGKVAIEGQSYDAYSQDGYIEANHAVTVVAKDNFKLIIKKL